jgi:hypothetical protein
MRPLAFACALSLALSACHTLHVTSSGTAQIPLDASTYDDVFLAALRATRQAGFVLQSSDKATGYIHATKQNNPLLANAPKRDLSVQVAQNQRGYSIEISSTLGGQMVAYGATQDDIDRYCQALYTLLPTAEIRIDGR